MSNKIKTQNETSAPPISDKPIGTPTKQPPANQAQDYEKLVEKSLEEHINESPVVSKDITNPNLHYGLKEDIETIAAGDPYKVTPEEKALSIQTPSTDVEMKTVDEESAPVKKAINTSESPISTSPLVKTDVQDIKTDDKPTKGISNPDIIDTTEPPNPPTGQSPDPEGPTNVTQPPPPPPPPGGGTPPPPTYDPDLVSTGETVNEAATPGTVIATLDLEGAAGTNYSYAITDQNGVVISNSNFTILNNQIIVSQSANIDYETNQTHTFYVTGTDDQGNSVTEQLSIKVTDHDEFDVSTITDADTGANAVDENAATDSVVGITALATDADGTDTVTYTLSDNAGGLFAIDANTGVVTVAGSLDTETATSHNITVVATSTDGSTSSETFTINVNNQDEFDISSVTDTNATANAIDEDASVGTTVGITALATDADASDTVTYSLSNDAGGLFAIDANTGVVTVAGSLDAETATSHNITVLATSTDGSTSSETFTINVNDQDEFDISAISDTNDTANAVDENAATGSVVGITALATDADATDTVTYSLSNNAGGLFAIDANTGVVTVAGSLDAETATSHNITVVATSTDGSISNETFTINVNDVNETSISAVSDKDTSANSVTENVSVGTAVGITALATDADITDTVTYTLSSNPGGFFAIDSNTGVVTVANDLDFETNEDHTIEITATSSDGTTSTQTFTIDVTDVDEFDVSAITDTNANANSIAENASVGTSVGITAFASDADGSNNGITYSLSNDASGLFAIDPNTGQVTVAGAIDYETATSQTIEVTATSEDGSTSTQTFTINVTDVDEFNVSAISDTNTGANAVDEDASLGSTVGITALATDADGTTNTVTYTLSDNAGGLFAIDANTGVVTVAGSLDAETATSHNITVLATSTDGSTSTETFTINVNDQDEFDISAISDTNDTANAVDENAATGSVVGITALATDADTTDTVTYTLSDNAGGLFAIDANTGVVTVAGSLNAETATSHNITVLATSTDGSTSSETFTINVNDQNETSISTISDTNTDADQVAETAAIGTAVGITALATDTDITDTVTYALSSNPGGFFAIDANTGVITTAKVLDHETAGNHTIEVTATSTDGSISIKSFTIDVTDVNEAPTDITFTGGTVNETVKDGGTIGSAFDPSGSTVATLSTSDVDSGDTFTYAIINDPSGHFEIVGNEVRVKAGQTIDFEINTSHDITIEVTDSAGNTYSETIKINVQDYEGSYEGSTSADTITGTSEEDTISTGQGSDKIKGSLGADIIDGGTGNDTIDYSKSSAAVKIDLENGTGSGGLAEGDTYTSVENVYGSDHDDKILGSSARNYLYGFDGDDTIYAGDGNDYVRGGSGADTLDGGEGIDTVSYSSSSEGVAVDLATGKGSGGDAEGDLITNFETLRGSKHDDKLSGDKNDNTITGNDGDDTILGGAGNDTLDGETGNDSLSGGTGTDAIDGGEGIDTVIYTGNWADYTISFNRENNEYTIKDNRPGSPDGTDTVTNVENFQFADATVPAEQILNDAPTDISVTSNTIAENTTGGTVVATLGSTDADSSIPSETATYTLTNDPSGLFEIVDNEIRVKTGADIDYETSTSHAIEVTVTDVHGATYSETLTINITDVDEFNVSTISDTNAADNAVNENTATGSVVGITALATDQDGTDTVSYTLSDNAGGLFAIDANTGVVTVAGSLDAETATSHNITVIATSTDGSTNSETFTIAVNDQNETRITTISDTNTDANQVSEKASIGTAVGITALATDADVTDTVTYTLSSNPGDFFAIDANTGVVTLAGELDYAQNANHTIEVTATSTDGSTTTASFTIDVSNINEAPTGILFETTKIREDASRSEGIGEIELNVIDPDGDKEFKFSVSDDRFEVYEEAGSYFLQVKQYEYLDHETEPEIKLSITVTDQGGLSHTQDVKLEVTDVNETPYGETFTYAEAPESISDTHIITTVEVFDQDEGDKLTYKIVDEDTPFEINQNGEVSLKPGEQLDYETEKLYNITVLTTDTAGNEKYTIVTFDVRNVNEAPTDITFTGGTVNETVTDGGTIGSAYDPSGSVVATLSTTDDDNRESFTYTITNDPSGHFEIVGNEVRVKENQTIDYETAASHDITVQVTDRAGNTFSEVITINVQDYEGNYTGTANNDLQTGTSEEDTIATGDGRDKITGSEGADNIDGGAGTDRIDYSSSDAGVTINLATGTASGGHAEGDTLTNIEDVSGSNYADNITGNDVNNLLIGNGGDDTLTGGNSYDVLVGGQDDDTLYGMGGSDTLRGGAGADTLDGGDGQDWASYATSSEGVTINLKTGIHSGGEATGDTLINIEKIDGSSYNDNLTGDANNNYLYGNAGDDILAGNDPSATSTNLIVNGSFENGSTGWTLDEGPGFQIKSTGDGYGIAASEGTNYLDTDHSPGNISFSQTVSDITEGTSYILSLDAADYRSYDQSLEVYWGGQLIDTVETNSGTMQTFTFDLVGGAGDGSNTLQFKEVGSVDYGGTAIDNIQLYENFTNDNDTLNGGEGTDTAVFSGNWADYTISFDAANNIYTIQDNRPGTPDGKDTVQNVEFFQFADGTQTVANILNDTPTDIIVEATDGSMDVTGSSGGYLEASNMADFPTSTFTMELSFASSSPGSATTPIASYAVAGSDNELLIEINNGTLKIFINGSTYDTSIPQDALIDGTEHQLSVSWDSTTGELKTYIDGTLEDTGTHQAGAPITTGGTLILGQEQDNVGDSFDSNQTFDGEYYDVRIFNDVRTAQEIADNAGQTLTDPETITGLVSYYNFNDEINGTTITDLAGNNNLTIVNNAEQLINIDENSTAGTVVATLGSTDADSLIPSETATYTLTNDPSGFFEIVGNEVRVKTGANIDYETATSHTIEVTVTDVHGATYSETLTINVENIYSSITGTENHDFLNGTSEEDSIRALGGHDTIIGGAGDDHIDAGEGNDSIIGGTGADTLIGGTGIDEVRYDGSDAVTVSLADGSGSGGDAQGDKLTGFENVIGSSNNDSITGDANANKLSGMSGDDTISGGGGNDEILGNSGSDSLYGNQGADTIWGGSGDDILDGGEDNDTLQGDQNNDSIYGGAGIDTAVYSGNWADYTISYDEEINKYTLQDNRPGSPDGTDKVQDVEHFQFADRTVAVADILNEAPTDIYVTNSVTKVDDQQANTYITTDQRRGVSAALEDGGYITTWYSYDQDGSGHGVFAQRFDANGNTVGDEFQVNTTTNNHQYWPNVTSLEDGGFAIAWVSIGQADYYDTIVQQYDANGNTVGGEIVVNTTLPGSQYPSDILGTTDGGYIVAWRSPGDGDSNAIYTQKFDATGSKVGTETQVNTTTDGNQIDAEMAATPEGGYIITWESPNIDEDGNAIVFQRFDSHGNKVGTETQANTTTAGDQLDPDIITLADGSFVIAWQTPSVDSDGTAIVAQHFAQNGDLIGKEFQINTTETGDQTGVEMTELQDGGFVVTWQSGSDTIAAQRFDATGEKVGPEELINNPTDGSSSHPDVIQLENGDLVFTWNNRSGLDGHQEGIFQDIRSLDWEDKTTNSTTNVDENATGGTVVATLATSDQDVGDTATYSLTNDPSGFFEIVGNEVRVKAEANIDYDITTSHEITVQVTDSYGNTYKEALTINVTDLESLNIAGTTATETLYGGGDDDIIYGDSGHDTIYAGTGDDIIYGENSLSPYQLSLNENGNGKDYAIVSDVADFPTNDLTIEIRFASSSPSPNGTPLFSYAVPGTDNEFLVSVASATDTLIMIVDGKAHNTQVPSSSLFDGTEHMLSISWDQNNGIADFYIDGQHEYTTPEISAGPLTSGGTIVLGQEQDTLGGGFQDHQVFEGTINEVRIFNDVRGYQEILDNHATPLDDPASEPGLISNWHFKTDTNGVVEDLAGNNNLTLNNEAQITEISYQNSDDTIHGGDGNDTIIGGIGDDILNGNDGNDLFKYQTGDGNDTVNGGTGNAWIDTINLQDGETDLGTYGTDWTVTLTQGEIESQNETRLELSDDADGTVNLQDGSTIDFTDIERIEW